MREGWTTEHEDKRHTGALKVFHVNVRRILMFRSVSY